MIILSISSTKHINKEFIVFWTPVMASLALYVLHKSTWITRINIYRDTYTFMRIKVLDAHKKNVKNKDSESVFYYAERWK